MSKGVYIKVTQGTAGNGGHVHWNMADSFFLHAIPDVWDIIAKRDFVFSILCRASPLALDL